MALFCVRWSSIDVRPYTGDYHAHFDASVIDEAISCWKDAPIAYWLSALNYINFLKPRWKEMVKPYFEKYDIFNIPESELINF